MSIEDLYQQLLLDHARAPKNRGRVTGEGVAESAMLNPICGDEVIFSARFSGNTIAEIKFAGHGCMISQAAASMLADRLAGCTIDEARSLLAAFRGTMQGSQTNAKLGDLAALEGVKQFPIRIKCALLPFDVAAKLIGSR